MRKPPGAVACSTSGPREGGITSPPTRVFEAAGAGACLITDRWEGIGQFLEPEREILVADSGADVAALLDGLDVIADTTQEAMTILRDMPEERRRDIAAAARKRMLACHAARERARALEAHHAEALVARARIGAARRGVGAVA